MADYSRVTSYRLVVECRERTGGFVQIGTEDGQRQHVQTFENYAELAAFADLLRNEGGWTFGDDRLVQEN